MTLTGEFCEECRSKSMDVSAGDVVSLNLLGRAFVGASNRCPHCDSTERKLFFFMGLPVIPLGTWKVKDVGGGRIRSRKLSAGGIADFDTHAVYTPQQQRRWHRKLLIGFLVFVVVVNVLVRVFK
jgi:hypothetical protein